MTLEHCREGSSRKQQQIHEFLLRLVQVFLERDGRGGGGGVEDSCLSELNVADIFSFYSSHFSLVQVQK